MVRDGIYYALGMFAAAALLWWATGRAWPVVFPLLLAAFFLWFFRDPERTIPAVAGGVVSPADGRVTHIERVQTVHGPKQRISIFLSVFNVHVNRAPVAGVVESVQYRKGLFGNAMGAHSSDANEQNIVTVSGEGRPVVFKQIAGLLARRIVFRPRVGDRVERGERIGMIKFGSRVDVIVDGDVELRIKVGDVVRGGASLLGVTPVDGPARVVRSADAETVL